MKLFVVLTSLFFISACSSSPVVSDRIPASDTGSEDSEVQNHPELKIELPFDPIYCDLNNNNNTIIGRTNHKGGSNNHWFTGEMYSVKIFRNTSDLTLLD